MILNVLTDQLERFLMNYFVRSYRKLRPKTNNESTSGPKTSMSKPPDSPKANGPAKPPDSPKTIKGVRVQTNPGLKVSPSPATLLTMSPEAFKLALFEAYTQGFAQSGKGFNAESFDVTKYPAVRSLLNQFFARWYIHRKISK